jgi:hypothetical protein
MAAVSGYQEWLAAIMLATGSAICQLMCQVSTASANCEASTAQQELLTCIT